MKKYVYRPYETIFPELFAREKERILGIIHKEVLVEHVGSTAVAGLGGKGIIDIAIACDRSVIKEVLAELERAGYTFQAAFSTEDRLYCVIDLPDYAGNMRRYHVHLTYPESGDWKGLLGFRDYLRNHPDIAKEYAEVKRAAALEADQKGSLYRKIKEPFFQKVAKKIK